MNRLFNKLALAACTLICLASTASAGINTWTSVGPEGGEIEDAVITPGTPSLTYVLTPRSLYRSSDAGQTWSRVDQMLGTMTDLAVHPTQTNRVFVVANADLLASSDGGATRVEVALPSAASPIEVEFSRDGALLYAASTRVLHRSSDLGATWRTGAEIAAPVDDLIRSIYIDPTDANRVVAVTNHSAMFVTSDGGDRWTPFTPPSAYASQIAFSPSGPRIWVATPEGLWYTTDSGANWTRSALTRIIWAVAVDPIDPAIVYAQEEGFIYRSNDGGANWVRGNGPLGIGAVNAFAFDPQVRQRVLIATLNGMWVSDDAGANWSPRNRGIVATTPSRFTGTTQRTYFASRGQLYYLDPGASSAEELNPTALSQVLPFSQFELLLGLHADRVPTGDRLFVGGMGGGLVRSTDSGQTWVRLADPLLNNVSVDAVDAAPDNPDLVIASTFNGIVRSIDGGDRWTTTSGVPAGVWLNVLATAPAGIAYAAGVQNVYKTTDAGLSWSRVNVGIPTTEFVLSVLIQGETAYIGTTWGAHRTTDGGATWTRLPLSHGGTFASDATGLYIGGSRSIDGGNTWMAMSPPPPDSSGMTLDPSTRGRLLMGTWYDGVQTYTVASDLTVTAAGQPSVPPASGARTELQFTVTNRGPHAVTGVRLNINVAGGRALYENATCSVTASARSQASCTLAEILSGQSKVVRIDSSFESAGSLDITASVEANETELSAVDNTFSGSWSYSAPTNPSGNNGGGGGGGGGGALSWWLLVTLASLTSARSPRRASPRS